MTQTKITNINTFDPYGAAVKLFFILTHINTFNRSKKDRNEKLGYRPRQRKLI